MCLRIFKSSFYMWTIVYKIDNFCVNKPKSMTRCEVWYSKQVTLVALEIWCNLLLFRFPIYWLLYFDNFLLLCFLYVTKILLKFMPWKFHEKIRQKNALKFFQRCFLKNFKRFVFWTIMSIFRPMWSLTVELWICWELG